MWCHFRQGWDWEEGPEGACWEPTGVRVYLAGGACVFLAGHVVVGAQVEGGVLLLRGSWSSSKI